MAKVGIKGYLIILLASNILIFVSISSIFNTHMIKPKLQHEDMIASLDTDLQAVFEKYRNFIPKIMKERKIPGLSIAVVDRDNILWAAGFGYTDYDCKRPVTLETIFSLLSVSQTITATAVMFAVQDGLVELDTPIINYLPGFTVNSCFEKKPHDKITLRHLLNHTSGLACEAVIGNPREAACGSFEEHIRSISDTWNKHRVGEKFSYSNIAFDLVAYILQVRSGKTFSEYVKEKIFDPLSMLNTSVDKEFIRCHPNRAVGHYRHIKELPLQFPIIGAAGHYASVRDLARFIQFYLNWGKVDGQKILSDGYIRTVYTPSPAANTMGLGIRVETDDHGNYSLYYDGSGLGFYNLITWSPNYGVGAVIMTNSNDAPKLSGILESIIKNRHVERVDSFDTHLWEIEDTGNGEYIASQSFYSDTFTTYKLAYKEYLGSYQYMMSGWKFKTYASIGLFLGFRDPMMHVIVYEKEGRLYIKDDEGDRCLEEHLPGLFFIASGECLDFRNSIPTWKNYRLKKVKDGKVSRRQAKPGCPWPADGITVRPDIKVKLSWRPSDTAISHKIYLGTDKSNIMLLAEGSTPEHVAELPIAEKDTTYYWRVDETGADGTIITGKIWQFSLGKLLGWWKLDGDAKDYSGNRHHGIIYGQPEWVVSNKVSVLKLDGVDDYVDMGRIGDLRCWTVAFCVKSPRAPSLMPQSGPVNYGDSFHINWNHPDFFYYKSASLKNGGRWYGASFGALQANTWYHLSATYDGRRFKTYKNGILITDDTRPSGIPNTDNGHLVFGKHSFKDHYFTGSIKDVRIYNYALRQDELMEFYKKGNEQWWHVE